LYVDEGHHNDENRMNDDTSMTGPAGAGVDTLIISDVHLGSPNSRGDECWHLLRGLKLGRHRFTIRRLVLLGDIFDDMNFRRLRKGEWKLLGMVREMTDPASGVEVVWIRGNHDREVIELMSHLVGTDAFEEYGWSVAGVRFFAMHGDQFDSWILDYPVLSGIPLWIYDAIQRVDGRTHRFSRFLKGQSKKWLRINEEVSAGIVGYVRDRGMTVDAVFCGHTHIAQKLLVEQWGIWYYNTGCWTGNDHPTYVTVDGLGVVRLEHFDAAPVSDSTPEAGENSMENDTGR
jgi:UDP-2,3-diacylglucosamine pyrophosphatase LpxH